MLLAAYIPQQRAKNLQMNCLHHVTNSPWKDNSLLVGLVQARAKLGKDLVVGDTGAACELELLQHCSAQPLGNQGTWRDSTLKGQGLAGSQVHYDVNFMEFVGSRICGQNLWALNRTVRCENTSYSYSDHIVFKNLQL